jgi:translation initiation factor IF-3
MLNNKNSSRSNSSRINDQIRCPTVMVIQDGQNLGTFATDEAKKIAKAAGLDLVEIQPQAKPPVCRIMDYGKFKYEQSIKEKEKKKNQKQCQDKEIRLSPVIGEHDLMNKINLARKFLEKSLRVHFVLQFKARQNTHKELGFKVIERITQELADIGTPSGTPKVDGKVLNCFIDPKK